MTVTRKQAEAVRAAIVKRYAIFFEPIAEEDGKVISRGDDPANIVLTEPAGDRPWMVWWEEGPYEWAYRATAGGVNDEIATILHQEFDVPAAEAGKRASEDPITFPPGVWVEPYTSYALSIYES